MTLHVAGEHVFEVEKTPSVRELLIRLRKFRGRLPKDPALPSHVVFAVARLALTDMILFIL